MEERKEHKKEISEIVNSPAYTKIANFTKNVVANGLIWTPLLATFAGMAGLLHAPTIVAAEKTPEKIEQNDGSLIETTDSVSNNYTIFERIVDKLMSGKFIWSVITAVTFMVLAIDKSISEPLIASIISSVTTFYFTKNVINEQKTSSNNK